MKSSVYRMSSGEVLENPFRGEIGKGISRSVLYGGRMPETIWRIILEVKVPRDEVSFSCHVFCLYAGAGTNWSG